MCFLEDGEVMVFVGMFERCRWEGSVTVVEVVVFVFWRAILRRLGREE